MKVDCVIVTYNIGDEIFKVFNSIYKQVENIIFVDNNSIDNTKKNIERLCDQYDMCSFVFNDINEGIAKALNQGIKLSMQNGADFILTLDHDSEACENMVRDMIKVYLRIKDIHKVGILSPAIYDLNKKDYLTEVNNTDYQLIKEPIQSGSLISNDLIKEVGYYNESLIIYYVDTEFCYRAIDSKYKLVQCNKVMLNHEEGKKTEHYLFRKKIYYNNYNSFAVYYRARNNIYMLFKYYSKFTSKNRLLIDFLKIIFIDKDKSNLLKFHFKGIRDGFLFLKNGKKDDEGEHQIFDQNT